ncbi:MAG: GTPase HflX [Candidatus Omnitrophota bacterium]|jgi:GTP-binding protein HflX
MERVLLVTVDLDTEQDKWMVEDIGSELEELASACGVEVVDNVVSTRDKATPDLFIGKGKVQELIFMCEEMRVDTVIFSHDLSGTQQRNLEAQLKRKTIDRTQLILEIFSKHANSPEGKLQVELAQLQYLMPRLVGKGLVLSRTGGGIGTSGLGEQKLELDRRRIRKRIEKLKNDLKHLSLHRKTIRKKRKDNLIPSVTLVGYTNAGKSTLLNTLTGSGQVVKDSLFTTLDSLSKLMKLPNGEKVVLSDTVGFLHKLPHHLIEAFKATLEEVTEADVLIHVLDVSHPRAYQHNKAVFEVLGELEAENKPVIVALNKIDLVEDKRWLEKLKEDFSQPVPVKNGHIAVTPITISAKMKLNLDVLLKEIQKNLSSRMERLEFLIPLARMDLVNLLYQEGSVIEIEYQQKGIKIKASIPKILSLKLLKDKDVKKLGR